MQSMKRCLAVAAMTGTLCAMSSAIADEIKQEQSADTSSALRVVRDAESGELRAPTPQELQQLVAAENAARVNQRAARSSAAASHAEDILPAEKQVIRHPNGMVSVRLSQESLTAIKAEVDAEGKAKVVHIPHPTVTKQAQEK